MILSKNKIKTRNEEMTNIFNERYNILNKVLDVRAETIKQIMDNLINRRTMEKYGPRVVNNGAYKCIICGKLTTTGEAEEHNNSDHHIKYYNDLYIRAIKNRIY
jgi:hypothetical protein